MSFTPLTKDGVPTLWNWKSPPPESFNPVLQIVQMKKTEKEKGGIIYRVALSDGDSFVDGALVAKLRDLVDSRHIEMNVVVKLTQFSVTEVSNMVVVIVIDVLILHNPRFPWGVPSHFTGVVLDADERERKSQEPLSLVKDHFVTQNAIFDDGPEDVKEGDHTCADCHRTVCHWALYGQQIMSYVDEMCEAEDLNLSNKEIRFLCYSGYSAMRHGYLGRHNRRRIPFCVEEGFRFHYPDDNGSYVGFRSAEEVADPKRRRTK
jgi:hypothetical protein